MYISKWKEREREKGENDSDDGLAYGISCKGFTKKQNVADIAFGF